MFGLSYIKPIWKIINIIREIFLNLFFLIMLILTTHLIGSLIDSKEKVITPTNTALVLDIQGVIVDNSLFNDEIYYLQSKLYGKSIDETRENSLFEITQKIAQATSDPNIESIILKLDHFAGADISSLSYIGKYLNKFKQADKTIYAIGSHYDQSQYYLASFANKIYLTPLGSLNVYGLATNNLYYKTLLENLKVNAHIFRVGTYKSAVEPFIRDDMSIEAKQNTQRWITTLWDNYLTDIASNRKRAADDLVPEPTTMITQLKQVNGNVAYYALDRGLIDGVYSFYDFELTSKQNNKISIYDYKLKNNQTYITINKTNKQEKSLSGKIAVVFVNGTITTGLNSQQIAGSDDIVAQLQAIRKNPKIQAVVLRVNSPGGSVEASEAIREELQALQYNKIPVVVSMGNMAASGGYWISTASNYIIASPNTITGSIGIFGVIPTFEQSLAHIGVYNDGVATSSLAGNTLYQELSPEKKDLIQISIENGYQNFINLVAKSRNMTAAQVDSIGQGQVWLGSEAKNNGLIDQLGDFDDAIIKAASLANLTKFEIDWQEPETSWFSLLTTNLLTYLPKSTATAIFENLPEVKLLKQQINLWKNFNDPQNRYIYCLNCTNVL